MRIAMKPLGWTLAAALVAAAGTLPATAPAQAGTGGQIVQIATNRGELIRLARPMSDIFVANPDIADVQVRSPTSLYVFGKKPGETTISATSKAGAVVYATTIRVGNNYDSIGGMLSLAMPEAHITATPMNGLVLLTGTVAGPEDGAEAERLVQAFVGKDTQIISRLKTATPLQVNLQVRFAEVSRSFVKNIGTNLRFNQPFSGDATAVGVSGKPGTITYDPTTGAKTSTYQEGNQRGTLALAGRLLGADFLGTLDLGETIGQVTTLANPNLTALSGETGTFLAGGEIPIPISQGLGAVSVEYKQYGVSLAYTPTVLSDGRISLRVRPEVSQLTSDGAVTLNGTQIPALTTRRAETTVELGSGQSFMIAGLLQNSHNNQIEKVPGVGDIPILGALFRSNGWKRNETELVIVITPYLVKPVNANDIVLPTDGYQAPTDLGRVFMGQLSSGKSGMERPKPTMAPSVAPQPSFGAVAPVAPGAPIAPVTTNDPRVAAPKGKKGASPMPGFSN